jgi:hypothetical protein
VRVLAELKEWEEREREIEAIEGARLELIRKALEQRDEEKDQANFQRLEHARQMRVCCSARPVSRLPYQSSCLL